MTGKGSLDLGGFRQWAAGNLVENRSRSSTSLAKPLFDPHIRDGPGDHQLLDLLRALKNVVDGLEPERPCSMAR